MEDAGEPQKRGTLAIFMKAYVKSSSSLLPDPTAKISQANRFQPVQTWKTRAKQLQQEGRFATIMKAYVNKTDLPLPASQAVKQQIRIPKNPHGTLTARPKFVKGKRLVVRKKNSSSRPEHNPESVEDHESASSVQEVSVSRSLNEQAFASKLLLFNDFPMLKKGLVSNGFDYFLGVCAGPALGKPPGWNWRNGEQSEYSIWYIQNLLRSDILFELIVAYAVALRLYLLKDLEGSRPMQAVAFHIQNALPRLRKRLEIGDAWKEDAIIWSVIVMCATTYIIQDFDTFKVHTRGLQQIVALRGGLDSLDKFGFFKRRVINIYASLSATFEHERKGMLAKTTLIYHQFPLTKPIIRKLSKFPPGFAEMPFQVSLSENMIDFIEHNLEAIRHPPQGPSQINGIYITDWILNLPLSKDERLIAVALITNSLYQDRLRRAQISPVNNCRIQKEFPHIITFQPSIKSECVIWSLLTLRNTVRFSPELRKWIDLLLEPLTLSKDEIAQLDARYIPIPRVLGDHERQPDEI